MNANEVTICLACFFKGEWEEIFDEIRYNRRQGQLGQINKYLDNVKNAVSIVDSTRFPVKLKEIRKPPFALFYKGDISLLNHEKILAVVGSRVMTNYGSKMTEKILSELPKETIIISGLAKGIDTKAHKCALKNNLKTIAVLGSGIDNIYPSENEDLAKKIVEKGGLIISEYPFDVEPKKQNFIMRNRIIAALCKSLLLIESYDKSGAHNTAIQALNFGKNICCCPNEALKNSNCNKLIKDGAYLIETANDLKDLL